MNDGADTRGAATDGIDKTPPDAARTGPPPAPEPASRYCPVQDFIDICVDGLTSLDELGERARSRGWQWRPIEPSPGGEASAKVTTEGADFWISVTRFSDSALLHCWTMGMRSGSDAPRALCDPEFPSLGAAMPVPGLRTEKTTVRKTKRPWWEWRHEPEDWRVLVQGVRGARRHGTRAGGE